MPYSICGIFGLDSCLAFGNIIAVGNYRRSVVHGTRPQSSFGRGSLVGIGLALLLGTSSKAQYTTNFQTNIISGVVSNWSGSYYVGYTNFADVLIIQNDGALSNSTGVLGYAAGSSNNTVLVTGTNSVWRNGAGLGGGVVVGRVGASNSLVIANGGQVFSAGCTVGGHGSTNRLLVGGGCMLVLIGTPAYDKLIIGESGGENSAVINGGCVVNGNGVLGANPSSGNNYLLVSGAGSVWSNLSSLSVGSQGAGNRMVISGGAQVFNGDAYLSGDGYYSQSRSNSVLVTGYGSAWSNRGTLYVGNHGTGSSLVISNGGRVIANSATIGYSTYGGSDNNQAVVTGGSSVWYNATDVYVGPWGSGNSLAIFDGGQVIDNRGHLGYGSTTVGNRAIVSDSGSVWSNAIGVIVGENGGDVSLIVSNGGRVVAGYSYMATGGVSSNNTACVVGGGMWETGEFVVGQGGSSNSLIVAGGSAVATNLTIGFASTLCNNLVQLDNGDITVTNSAGSAVLEVRRGKFILNGGTLQVDKLVITNACGLFVRNGGTFIAGSVVLDSNFDADGDGIVNGWERAYGLDPLNADDADTDNDGDNLSNLQEYLAGTNPTNSASAFRILSAVPTNDDVLVTWATAGDHTNVVQSAADLTGSYTNISPSIVITGSGDVTTNYLDAGAATKGPTRVYRVRLVP
jgi:T5SS/PEP-CTERM-associated repeat protein